MEMLTKVDSENVIWFHFLIESREISIIIVCMWFFEVFHWLLTGKGNCLFVMLLFKLKSFQDIF